MLLRKVSRRFWPLGSGRMRIQHIDVHDPSMTGACAGARLKNSLCHIGQPALDQNLLFHVHVGAPPDVITRIIHNELYKYSNKL